ncbi:MAG: hypothetical protein NVSMB21_23920 [Vulcanimicrobiaceae bacterium]
MRLRDLGPLFGEAFGVLVGNRTRTILTITGLIIGVAAVIAIQILGKGMSGAVSGVLGSLNDRSFFLFPNTRQANSEKAAIRYADIAKTTQLFPDIVVAIPAGSVTRLMTSGHHRARLALSADSDVSFATVPLRYGRGFTRDDVTSNAHVAVLKNSAYLRLFPRGGDPIGASLRVAERRFIVIGVQEPPRQGLLPANFGGDVFVPYTTYVNEYVRSRNRRARAGAPR